MKIQRAILIVAMMAISLTVIVSRPATVVGQGGQPDSVDLEIDTAPNILLVEIVLIQPNANGVEAIFTVHNPLRTLYLALDISGDYTSLDAESATDQGWDTIGLVPPQTTLTFHVQFESTEQVIRIESPLISLRGLTFNFLEIAGNQFAGDFEPETLIEAFLENATLAEALFTNLAVGVDCLDTPTIADIDDCIFALSALLDEHLFQDMMVEILTSAGLAVGPNDIADLLAVAGFIEKWANVADGLVYISLAMWSGESVNRYYLRPRTLDLTLLPPWPPRPNYPVGFALRRQPRFEWNAVPDVNFYELEVDEESDFATPVLQIRAQSTFFNSPFVLEPNTTYYWRVRAVNINAVEPSAWSTVSFITGTTDPSGGLIAYVDDNEQLWIAYPDGRGARQLPIDWTPRCPDFSPNGRMVSYVNSDYRVQVSELILLDLATNQKQVVVDDVSPRYDWSPDSSQIAFSFDTQPDFSSPDSPYSDPQGIWLLDVETGETRTVIDPPSVYPLNSPVWSPDGSQIAIREVEYIEGAQPFRIGTLDGELDVWDQQVGYFDWSPDGSRIIFDESIYGPSSKKLFVADPDGSNMQVIIEDPRFYVDGVAWSPNGQEIVFKGAGDFGPETVDREISFNLVRPDGSNLRQIPYTVTGFGNVIDWSPDSSRLLIGDESGLKIINLNGSVALNLGMTGGCAQWLSPQQTATILDIFGDMEAVEPPIDEPTITVDTSPSGPSPTRPPTSTTASTDHQCPGAPAARLSVDQQARQSLNRDSVLVRQNFDIDRYPFELFPGEIVDIIGGPDCQPLDSGQLLRWWQVRNEDGQVGWAPEGIPGRYFFEPLNTTIVVPEDAETCAGTLPSRLTVGGRGRVLPGTNNNVRSQAGTNYSRDGQIPGGASFSVLGGPICAEGYAWWEVDYNGLVGWTAEADNVDYWLEPVN